MTLAGASPSFAESFDGRWGASVDVGVQTGESRTLGETSLFAPLWQNDTSLLFSDLRGMFDNDQAREGNIGLGFRHMLDNGWNLGAYGYLDIRRTSLGNTFHQATFGVEALSEIVDLRANAYLPIGGSEKSFDVGAWSSVATSGVAVLTGTQLGIQTTTTTTLGTTTVTEKAMTGFDAEVGVRLPVFPDDMKLDLRAFAGGYHFEADGVRDITGPRGRLELTARDFAGMSGVKLTGGLTYQKDDVRGDQLIASARLTVPLQAPSKLGDMPPLTYMEQRMTDAVVRDVDIITGSRADNTVTSVASSTIDEDAVNALTGITIGNVIQVNGAGDLGVAIATAGNNGMVIVQGGAGDLTGGVTLLDGQTLIGGGYALSLTGATTGIAATYTAAGTQGTVSETANAPIIRAANNSHIGGLEISGNKNPGGGQDGINITNVANVYVDGNTIHDLSYGIYGFSSTGVSITNNNIQNIAFGLLSLDGISGTVSANTFDGYSDAFPSISVANSTLTGSGNVHLNATGLPFCNDGGGNTGNFSYTDDGGATTKTCP